MAITFPVSPAIRWGIYLTSAGLAYLDSHGYLSLFDETDEQGQLEWRRLHLVYNRTSPTGTTEDVALCTFDLVNFTDGEVDPTWTSGDYTAAEALFNTWWTSMKALAPTGIILKEYRWYRAAFGEQSGPPQRVTTVNVAGTVAATTTTAFQIAMSVTELTCLPRSWGRFYHPGVNDAQLDNYGRWLSTAIDGVADYTEILYNGLYAAQLVPCVPSEAAQTLLNVQAIQVDDIPDVVRRRRAKMTLLRDKRVLV